jgi:hypothetical protein
MINVKDLTLWYQAQELVYASATRPDNYNIRLSISQFGDFPIYTVMRCHVVSLKRKELYRGTSVEAAVRIYNEEAELND